MNWDIVQGNWKQFKGIVQQKWGKLTDDHLDTIAGRREISPFCSERPISMKPSVAKSPPARMTPLTTPVDCAMPVTLRSGRPK